jgi:hypothetical protein
MTPGRRVVLSLVGLLAGFVLVVVALRAMPPSKGEQLATTQRLEAVLVRMDELGLDGWHDCALCQPIDIRPGASPVPLPSGITQFEAMRMATAGVIPNGRLVEITTLAGPDEPGGRVVQFTAVAQSMLGAETGHDLWIWTWHAEPQGSPTPGWISPNWDFKAASSPDTD